MSARISPVDAVGGAPSYTGRYLRQTTVAPFLAMATNARPLGAVSGVRPGTPSSIVSATSTTWTVTPFAGVIDGATAAIAGPYSYSFDTNQTGSVTAAGASARTDRLDVQVVDPAEGGVAGLNPLIQIVYTAGTPSLAAAPAQSHPLAQINVPASGGGSPTVTWAATYYAAAGAPVSFLTYNSGVSPLTGWTTASFGQAAVVVADSTAAYNRLWFWNGTSWTHSLNGSVPFATAAGSASNGAGSTTAVTFPTGRFTVAPLVTMANTGSTVSAMNASGITAAGANMAGYNAAGSAIATNFMWVAVQMTATTAAG